MQPEAYLVQSSHQAYHPPLPSERQHKARDQSRLATPSRHIEERRCLSPSPEPHPATRKNKQTHLVKASQQAGDPPLDILLGQAGASSVAPHGSPPGDARDGDDGGDGLGGGGGGEGRSRDDRGEAAAGGDGCGHARRGGGGGPEDGCAEHFDCDGGQPGDEVGCR